ncbi:hypothetical protein DPMN_152564 [Dreissena polymorpha]|uniref:Uncharacterized protein n=1 Tax=Dreissena polymorpha TaxID=45954 RepID=A0A9D4FM24_DREPO|nr:hypothetical protein DPMN_152564 [Dreissena polymorpha]
MKQFQTHQKERMKSLKVSYNENEKLMMECMRLHIDIFFHEYENSIVNTLREKIQSLLADYEKGTVKEKEKQLILKQAPLRSVRNNCIRLHNDLLHFDKIIHKVRGRDELSFISSRKCEEKLQQSETWLKENFSNCVFTENDKSEYHEQMPSDFTTCRIK